MAAPAAAVHRRLRLLPPSILIRRVQRPVTSVQSENPTPADEEIALITLPSSGEIRSLAPDRRISIFGRVSWGSPKSILKKRIGIRERVERRHSVAAFGLGLLHKKKGAEMDFIKQFLEGLRLLLT